MKINAWKLSDCSKVRGEFKISFSEWQEPSIFPHYVNDTCPEKEDYEETIPSNLCSPTERNFVLRGQFQETPPDSNLNSGTWMTKWRNRTVVKFSRGTGKQREDCVGNMGGVRKAELSKCGRKQKCAHGIQSLLMALEYIEMQERLQQELFDNR